MRGFWGWFLDSLQSELTECRRRCREAEPGAEADAAYDDLRAMYDVMEWAAKQVYRLYLEDLRKCSIDWGWDRGETKAPEVSDPYPGDHTL